MFIGTRKKSAHYPCFFNTTAQTTLHLILLVLPTLLLIVSGSPINGKNNKVDTLEKIIKHNSTSYPILPLLIINENKNESSSNGNNNNNNNSTFALIQGTKLERESTSSGWQINAGVYLEKSIGDGHSTMWESSSDDDSSDEDLGGWGWAKGAGKSKSKKKFSMLSHSMEAPQLSSHVDVVNGTSGNGSATIRLFSHDGVLGIDQLTLDSLAESELAMVGTKFKLKNQHSWSEKGDTRDNKELPRGDGCDDDDDDDNDDGRLRSDASYIWNKVYDLVKLYVLVLWMVFEG